MGVHDDIFDWVSSFPSWKQDLFLTAASSPTLTDAQISRSADQLLGDLAADPPRTIVRGDLPQGAAGGATLVLGAISEVDGVNALAFGQRLEFAPSGVSLVYGHNGAGKTGYCRILKFGGRTLVHEEVRAHVGRAVRPRATVSVLIDGQPKVIDVDFEYTPPPELSTMHVFDAHAADHYVTREHTVDYIPPALRSIERFADALRRVAEELARRADAPCPQIDPGVFATHTEAGRLVANLSPKTTEEQIQRLAVLSTAERETLSRLAAELAEIQSRNASRLRADAELRHRQISDLGTGLADLARKLDATATQEARDELETLADCEQAAELAAAKLNGLPVSGVGTRGWRAMYDAACTFAEHTAGHPLPPADDHSARCPLCMQELDHDARQRLRDLDEFVHANVTAQLEQARRAVRARRDEVPDVAALAARHREAIAFVEAAGAGADGRGDADREEASAQPVTDWLDAAAEHATRIVECRLEETLANVPKLPAAVQHALSRLDTEIERHARLEQPEEQRRIKAQLDELSDRVTLSQRVDQITERVVRLRQVELLRTAINKTASTGASTKLTQMCKSFISAELETALNRHLRALNFGGLEVRPTTRTAAGQPMVGLSFKTVDGAPLATVLSAGEQRRLALAMFLAECEASGDRAPVVLDDPCCSLDQEGRRHIARSLAGLAADRQVVVLTHDLPFVAKLRNAAAALAAPVVVHVQQVVRVKEGAGVVRGGLPWEGLRPHERVAPLSAKLNAAVDAWRTEDQAQYRLPTEDFCNYLRQAYERVVEVDILGGAIERGDDAVHTQRLSKALIGQDEIVDMAVRGMTETSAWVHDRSAADNPTLPTVDEMTNALGRYRELLNRIKAVRSDTDREKKKATTERRAALQAADGAQPTQGTAPTTYAARKAGRERHVAAAEKRGHGRLAGSQLPLDQELARIVPPESNADELPTGGPRREADAPPQAIRP